MKKERKSWEREHAFTLIELLVVIGVIAILVTLSTFGLQGAREEARNTRRKADLEVVRQGLELYRADCGSYPPVPNFPAPGGSLVGNGSRTSCANTNTYISTVPADPQTPARTYVYRRPSATTYTLCTSLENGPTTVASGCSGVSCGSGATCNYSVSGQ